MRWNEDGYRLRYAPQALWLDALEMINRAFGQDFSSKEIEHYNVYSFFPKLAASYEMREIGRKIAREVFSLDLDCKSTQIALRLPGSKEVPWHIDGIAKVDNLNPYQAKINFEATLGLYLSNVDSDSAHLNLKTGSHVSVEKFGSERGFHLLRRGVLPENEHAVMPIKGIPGTAFVFSPYMIHSVSPNRSPHIRYALYWRLFDPKAWDEEFIRRFSNQIKGGT